MTAIVNRGEHLLLYEPRTEGHHLGWLRFITEDLLSAGLQLTLAVDQRSGKDRLLHEHLGELRSEVVLINAYDAAGRRHAGGKARSVAHCLRQSAASSVFLCALDEIASDCWRQAAIGLLPPAELRGRMGGIYHRPRFMEAPWWSPNRWLKSAGFARLLRQGWLRQLLFVDEYLAASLQRQFPGAPVSFLPDPCPMGYDGDPHAARRQLEVPAEKFVCLFYGVGDRRKGLHVAVEAMQKLPADSRAFLLCAGQQNPEEATARALEDMVRTGRARVINRYVTVQEEKMCFVASDAVLLPYLNHFGTSGVLSRAMAAGKMVVVSDEQLLGRLTREHGLGLLFRSGSPVELRKRIVEAAGMPVEQLARQAIAAHQYAQRYSREAYRAALLASLAVHHAVKHE